MTEEQRLKCFQGSDAVWTKLEAYYVSVFGELK